ncbi:hypothetical protein [Actinocrispum sp. NPDC049592]|uniref:hypothetical protein n=1 Tax=Actinocrispum sp. NPDC049592 TaxID=3154835 RepID=UPI003421B891
MTPSSGEGPAIRPDLVSGHNTPRDLVCTPDSQAQGAELKSQRGRHRRNHRSVSWTCIVERVLACWPSTLRAALLLIILLGGLAVVLIAVLGAVPAACVATAGLATRMIAQRVTRRRLA